MDCKMNKHSYTHTHLTKMKMTLANEDNANRKCHIAQTNAHTHRKCSRQMATKPDTSISIVVQSVIAIEFAAHNRRAQSNVNIF